MAPDPLHYSLPDSLHFSRINNAEVLPGVMTAASWSFWNEPVERSLRRAMHKLGALRAEQLAIPHDLGERTRAVFHGRVATNVSFHQDFGRHLPNFLEAALVVHVFGDKLGDAPRSRRSHAYFWRLPWQIARLPGEVRAGHRRAKHWWRAVTHPDGAPKSLAEAIAAVRRANEEFQQAMDFSVTASALAAVPVHQITKLAKAAGLADLIPAVISGYGTEEVVMGQRLSAIAAGQETIERFLQDFGFHGQAEGQLHRTSWREAPEAVEARVASFRGGVSHGRTPEGVRRAQREAEEKLLAGVPAATRLRLHLMLARRLMPLREVGKAWYLMAIDAGRTALRCCGGFAVAQGLLDEAADIFHLTLDEIFAGPSPDWRPIAAARKAQFVARQAIDIPDRFAGTPNPVLIDRPDHDAKQLHIKGIGASAGIVEGRARVLRETDSVDELCDGEILVCRSTDPSWAPAFMIASGVVIDIGSMLSHGAIVARELGLPCVINTGMATSLVRTGDTVRIDGCTGDVEIVERMAA